MSLPAKGPGRRGPKPRQTARPGLEILEDRTLLSAALPAGTIDLGSIRVDPAAYAPGHILVQLRPGVSAGPGFVTAPGTSLGPTLDAASGLYEVRLAPGVTVSQAVAAYRADARVLVAEPDYVLTSDRIPNDPSFGQLWADRNTGQLGGTPGADIHATQAWDVTTGNDRTVVAVMDTGVDYDHPDLYQNIWINQAEIPLSRRKNLIDVDGDGLITFRDLNDPRNQGVGKITDVNGDGRIDAADILAPMVKDAAGHDTGRGGWADGVSEDGDTAHVDDLVGWNFVNNTNNPFDDNSHGTHVSGTIAAMGNNGVGVTGVDWQAQIMACKFLNSSGVGAVGNFIVALDYAVAHGARISNNSWAGAGNSQILFDAINNARAHGHIVVAAAGNGAANNDVTPNYPSSYTLDNVVSVAATDPTDHLAGFSNYGARSVALAAPGVGILSTTPNATYSSFSGTSMATPQVTGVLALVWDEHPTWTYQQVVGQVLNTVDVLPALQGKVRTNGRLDAARAVGWTVTTTATPRLVASAASGSVPFTLSSVRVYFNVAINPATFTAADVVLSGPNGQAIPVSAVHAVPYTGNTQFDISFPAQGAPGNYYLRVGPNVTDASGTPMDVYLATYHLVAPYTVASTQAVPIADVSKAVSTLTVPQDLTISRVTVKVNIQHTYDQDLYIHVQAPDGTDILLSNRRGGSGHNYQGTVFDDQAATSIRTGVAPFVGSYQPEVPLINLSGRNARGTWKLWVEDRAAGDVGTVLGWSLSFAPSGSSTLIASVPAAAATLAAVSVTPLTAPPVPAPLSAGVDALAVRIAAGLADNPRVPTFPVDGGASTPPPAGNRPSAGDIAFASPRGINRLMAPAPHSAPSDVKETPTDDADTAVASQSGGKDAETDSAD
jgi:subtilisin family serine protease/subtilisin-like proprotein convertase family protein